ncbi:glycosyl hydrolase family 95 catalytic domain-containing protein [Agromyces sp. SYSU T00194]|uniref:glycosyl hydrolase family 95 catalytic domain-containing protein n=1 Tax=Agromyces chitinivorans TaxID=3158560 RepID=UPI00339B74A6
MSELRYDAPAERWVECLPLGNGRLGAMIDGALPAMTFHLNDGTAWSGSPASELRDAPDAARSADALARSRAALADGDVRVAEQAVRGLQSRYSQAFLPFADLVLTIGGADAAGPGGPPEATAGTGAAGSGGPVATATGAGAAGADASGASPAPAGRSAYRRRLDLPSGVHEVRSGALTVSSFASGTDGVLVIVVDGLPPGAVAGTTVALSSQLRVLDAVAQGDEQVLHLRMPSDVAPGHEPDLPAAEWDDAPGAALEGALVVRRVEAGDRAGWLVATETTYTAPGRAPEGDATAAADRARARIDLAAAHGLDGLRTRHEAEHRAAMDRVRIDLGEEPAGAPATDARLRAAASAPEGALAHDPALVALVVEYGRYLLWSSARPGGLPPNLQGIWNAEMRPPWSSNYTVNINTQMNHWASFTAALPETAAPLRDFVLALAEHAVAATRRLYDAPGWTVHHNTDAWGFAAPAGRGGADPRWAAWPMAGAWLARHLWEPVAFGAASDDELREAWPAMRGAAEFALHWHHRDGRGDWSTAPSTSPENAYLADDGAPASLDRASAMDLALLRDLFEIVVEAAERLGLADDAIAHDARARLGDLPAAPAIDSAGRLLEWSEPRTEEDPHHRHVSHLYGLYPGAGTWDEAHRAAAAATLERRGDESTGWSLAWKLALWARLGRGDKVGDLLELLLRPADDVTGEWAGGLYPNLLAAHPPFQIDGNLGSVAGVLEALVQSHDGCIELLPALPPALADGSVRGVIARPGIEVDVEWASGALVRATVRAHAGAEGLRVIRYAGIDRSVRLRDGESVRLEPSAFDGPAFAGPSHAAGRTGTRPTAHGRPAATVPPGASASP